MKSFLSGRPIASVTPLRSLSAPPPAGAGHSGQPDTDKHAASHDGHASPHVECVKQGDKVVRLVVTCTCGERIEIDCVYPTGG